MCVAGGAYLPAMTDTVLMTEGSGLFLAGPALVQAAIGQKTDAEELGGAQMHAEISGTVDFKEPNDHLCMARLRSLVGKDGRAAGCISRCGGLSPPGVRRGAGCAEICGGGRVWISESRAWRKQCVRHARDYCAPRGSQRV